MLETRPTPDLRLVVASVAAATLALLAGCTGPAGGSGGPASSSVHVVPVPQATLLTTFGAGSYLVGRDVALARYQPSDGCSWTQDDAAGQLLDRSGSSRPTDVLTLSTAGSVLIVTGELCRFTQL